MINLTKENIIDTNNWYLSNYSGIVEGYFWKHKNLENNNYTFYMKRHITDGFTIIIEEGTNENKLFEGYITNIEELNQIVKLCKLHEI